jgi:uncharacterized membrane protein YpjA
MIPYWISCPAGSFSWIQDCARLFMSVYSGTHFCMWQEAAWLLITLHIWCSYTINVILSQENFQLVELLSPVFTCLKGIWHVSLLILKCHGFSESLIGHSIVICNRTCIYINIFSISQHTGFVWHQVLASYIWLVHFENPVVNYHLIQTGFSSLAILKWNLKNPV